MAALAEQTVQMAALQYLTRHYRWRAWGKPVFAQPEVRTKAAYGNKRADGLIAFEHWFWGVYVVSIEAKSIKTLEALTPRLDTWRLVRNSAWAGLLFTTGSGALFPLYRMADGFWQLLIPFNVLLLSALLYGYLTFDSGKHKAIKVIDQLRQYPANQQWLAFSSDSVWALPKDYQRMLRHICKAQGVGVVLVSPKGKSSMWVRPRTNINWVQNFLSYYSMEQDIRALVTGTSKPTRRKKVATAT